MGPRRPEKAIVQVGRLLRNAESQWFRFMFHHKGIEDRGSWKDHAWMDVLVMKECC